MQDLQLRTELETEIGEGKGLKGLGLGLHDLGELDETRLD